MADFGTATLERFPFALAHGPRSNTLFDCVIYHSGDAASAETLQPAVFRRVIETPA
jgi:hypothetical protein